MLQKLKDWWRGEFISTPLDKILDGDEFDNIKKPKTRLALESIAKYLKERHMPLLGVFIGIATIITMLYIHEDSKVNTEPQNIEAAQKENSAIHETPPQQSN